jgi:exodeoxyribonuclease VII small subunit
MEGLSYEAAITELQDIMNELQDEQVSMERLSERSERARALIQYCQAKLRDLETTLGKAEDKPGPSV